MNLVIIIIVSSLLTVISPDCFSQFGNADTAIVLNRRVMPAGSRFAASRQKQFWWGKHWRKEWLQPVSFPILRLDTIAGGLTPIKRGGGHETKSLRFLGRNGREYVLRTIDKSLDLLIPDDFKGSFINEIVNDQISIAHPYGPLVIANLSRSIGILHTNPIIGFVPDNALLGKFGAEFSNKLCLFEERPSGTGWRNNELTNFADQIINSEDIFKKLLEDNTRQVDQKEFLKVRLFDMLVNDWDRHEDQWVWAAHRVDGRTVYQAFARDRDQAFSKTDGVSLFFLSRPWALRNLQNWDADLKDVIGVNLSATSLDRKFTNALDASDWKNIISNLQNLLTDSVIKTAVRQLPPEIYKISGDALYQRLVERKANMMRFGMRYYEILNREITIALTDKPEVFVINRINSDEAEIVIQKLDKENRPGDTTYCRRFDYARTRAINLYGLKGDDRFTSCGVAKSKLTIRIIGGMGKDLYVDSTTSAGIGKRTKVYDLPQEHPVAAMAFRYKSTTDTAITNYNRRSFRYDWYVPLIVPGYNPDDGLSIGVGINYKKRHWYKQPFGWQQSLLADYAAATGAFSITYKGLFRHSIGKLDLDIEASYEAPSFVVNFYGFGNDTKLANKHRSFYRVRANAVHFSPGLSHSWHNNIFSAGLVFNAVKIENSDGKFLSQMIPSIDSSVFSNKYFAGTSLSYALNTADNIKNPHRGINYSIKAEYQVNVKTRRRDFLNLRTAFTIYYTFFEKITIAHRTGAAINSGDYEFYQANTIGGSENLRGYWRTRFTGTNSFYQNTDIRIKLAELQGYVFRGALGVYGFFDDGRVWIKNEHSNVLHAGYGGGIYFVPYNRLAVNLSFASSKEVHVFTFRTGFLF
jgi:hypothetical protein